MYSSYSSINSIILKGGPSVPIPTMNLISPNHINTAGYLAGIISNDGMRICYTKGGNNTSVYYSSDGGQNWNTSTGVNTAHDKVQMAADSTGQFILLVSSTLNTRPYYSTNYGQTFTQPTCFQTLANGYWGCFVGEISGSYPSVLCVAGNTGLYTSTDNAVNASSNKIGSFKINGMAGTGQYIACCQDTNSTTNNMIITSNNGTTFGLFSPQINFSPTGYGRDIALGRKSNGTIYALYSNISTNATWRYNGSSWSQLVGTNLNSGGSVPSYCDMSDSGKLQTIYNQSTSRGFYSLDYGETWNSIISINATFTNYDVKGMICSNNGKYVIGVVQNQGLFLITFPEEN